MYRVVAVVVIGMYIFLGIGVEAAELERALRMIVVRDQKEAQDIQQKLREGASFSALARMKSIGPERLQWGYSGLVRLDDVQAALRPVLQQLQPGQISDVLALGRNYVIVKVISPKIPHHFEAAKLAVSQGQTAQALQDLLAVLRLEPDSVEAFVMLGLIYEREAQYEKAITHLEKAQRLAPKAAQIAILRGSVYANAAIKQQDDTYARKSLISYRQAMRLDERLAPAVNLGLGKAYLMALKQPEKALPYLEKAVDATPNVPVVYSLLIQAYYDTQRYQQAWQQLRVAQSLGFRFPKLLAALHEVKQQQSQR